MEKSLKERLKRHPGFEERVLAMLDIMDAADANLIKANDAEERVIEEIQKAGHQMLTGWARTREAQLAKGTTHMDGIIKNGKKT